MRSALVTGAAGFIGSHLVDKLLDYGWRVTGLDNLSTGRRSNLDSTPKQHFKLINGDIRDETTVKQAIRDVDVVFHQAGFVSVPQSTDQPAMTTDINCTGTACLLEAARDANVNRVILASSAAVYGTEIDIPVSEDDSTDPESPYALSKLYTEQLAKLCADQYGIETVALRYFNVYGPRQDPSGAYAAVIPHFIQRMQDGKRPVIYGDGEQSRDFVHVTDVVEANCLAAEADCSQEVFNIGGGSRMTINELVDVLNDVLGTNLQPIYDDPRPGDVRHSEAEITKSESILDYNPQTEFKEGMQETVAYFNSR